MQTKKSKRKQKKTYNTNYKKGNANKNMLSQEVAEI